ncbi:MAG: hypothetical protein ACFE9S_19270 [Candidatus Hermodarchaeota archaeon]
MKRNQKLIIAIVLIIIVATSGSLLAWFLFFRDFPGDVVFYYPDLTISNYSLEEDNLTVSISNIGEENATDVFILAKIDSLALELYNNSQTPIDLDVNEIFIFSINLSEFEAYFSYGNTYTINIQLDPNDDIIEELENNNEINIDYLYEGEIPPIFDLFSPNTYCLNSSIDKMGYAVVFNASQITLEDSLIITNGTINGYRVVNSTILDKTNVTDTGMPLSIALYRNQNLTIRNIWNSQLSVVLCNESSISLFNCSIQQVASTGSNNIFVSNSTIQFINSAQGLLSLSSLTIKNNSKIDYCIISSPISLEIEYSSLQALYIIASGNPYTEQQGYHILGTVRNCSVYGLQSYGLTDLNIYGTEIYQMNVIGNTRLNLVECIVDEGYVYQSAHCILNNSQVLSELSYGIIVSSDSVNITNGVVEGTSYINNTVLINANVTETTLMSVFVNNTGRVMISNYSCNVFLYDEASLTINDNRPISSDSIGILLEDSARFIGRNSSFGFVFCQENSSIELSENSFIQSAFINSTNDISIDNCTFNSIAWYSEPLPGYYAEIVNSTVGFFLAPPSCKVDIINCSIEALYEGIKFQSGVNVYNSSGIFGGGSISDYLNITGSTILNRSYKYIEITGDATVAIEDLYNLFSISIDSGILTVHNCTLQSLQMMNDAIVYLDNCTSPDTGAMTIFASLLGPQAFTCLGNSQLYINSTKFLTGNMLMLYNSAQATITESIVYGLYIFLESTVNISDSNLYLTNVAATSLIGYALNLIRCTIEHLITSSWNYLGPILPWILI